MDDIARLGKINNVTEIMEIDKHHELYCYLCRDLLLTPPIMLTAAGKNVCGKCRVKCDDLLVENVWYELLARQFQFPCKYAAEGCIEKISFGGLGSHEEKCPYQVMKCPLEFCACSGIPAQMIIHWLSDHLLLKIEANTCKMALVDNNKSCYMLPTKGLHFLIHCAREKSQLIINVQNLNPLLPNNDVTFVFNVFTPTGKNICRSVLQLKQTAEIDTRNFQEYHPLSFSVDVVIAPYVIDTILQQLNEIQCPYCSRQMTIPILKCPKGHLTCLECTFADYDFCSQCVENEVYFKRSRTLEYIAVSSVFICKWDGCQAMCNYKDIRAHEQSCCKRQFMCLHCFEWYGVFDDITHHDEVCPLKPSLHLTITDTQFTIFEVTNSIVNRTLLAFREIFMLTFEPSEGSFCARVSNFGPVSCFPWYKYEVDLHHRDDATSAFNKTLEIRDKSHNEYHITIPQADIDNLGGVKHCKVTFRIVVLTGAERDRSVEINLRRFN